MTVFSKTAPYNYLLYALLGAAHRADTKSYDIHQLLSNHVTKDLQVKQNAVTDIKLQRSPNVGKTVIFLLQAV